ncbi:DUF1599 domain-containing protein [Clostridium estertheticum]|uniref:DUF1599 domain-containing protein n=1 Tax=Clostridium estertheticum TaxID=238834 RepID=UPI002162FC9D|nr:DUF1599 domain-containing protein [Clostridium estertheticum]
MRSLCWSCQNGRTPFNCICKNIECEYSDNVSVCGEYIKNKNLIVSERKEQIKLTKTMRHMEVCKELNSLYEAKNHDYGDSFAKVRNELGNTAILVRLYDKVERLKTLLQGAEQKVKDESIEDCFKDLANYCIMELVERAVDKDDIN